MNIIVNIITLQQLNNTHKKLTTPFYIIVQFFSSAWGSAKSSKLLVSNSPTMIGEYGGLRRPDFNAFQSKFFFFTC